MRRLLLASLLIFAFPQTHTFPALDTTNAFTGTNSFAGPTTLASTSITSLTSPLTLAQTTANYTLQWNNPAAARTLTVPDTLGNDTFAFLAATQTFTNKTFTTPTLSSPVYNNPNLLISATSPTIAGAGCGGTLATVSAPNGTASFNIFTGTAPTSSGCTVTMPTATTDWNCEANHVSAVSTTNFIILQTGALSTASVTLQLFSDVAVATAPAASDTWRVTCTAN